MSNYEYESHTVNEYKHIQDSQIHVTGLGRLLRRLSLRRAKEILERLIKSEVAGESEGRLCEGMLRSEQSLLAGELALHFEVSQPTRVILIEEKGAIK